jgi:Cytochrome D1 heme domain
LAAEYTAYPDPRARTHMVELGPGEKKLYTINEVVNEIGVLEATTGQFLYSIAVGNRPSEIMFSRDGKRAFVSVRGGENKVKRIDLARRTVTSEVATNQQPDTLQLTPDERLLVVSLRGTPAEIQVFDARTLTLVATVEIAGAGTIAGHNWLSANGRYTFVTFEGGLSPGIAVVDHKAGHRLVATYPYPGGGRPHGIFYDDPAASEGPGVGLARRARVASNRIAMVRVSCSAQAVVFCAGKLALGGGSARFNLEPGRKAMGKVKLSKRAFGRLLHRRRLSVRASAVAHDQLGNVRKSVGLIALLAPESRGS